MIIPNLALRKTVKRCTARSGDGACKNKKGLTRRQKAIAKALGVDIVCCAKCGRKFN